MTTTTTSWDMKALFKAMKLNIKKLEEAYADAFKRVRLASFEGENTYSFVTHKMHISSYGFGIDNNPGPVKRLRETLQMFPMQLIKRESIELDLTGWYHYFPVNFTMPKDGNFWSSITDEANKAPSKWSFTTGLVLWNHFEKNNKALVKMYMIPQGVENMDYQTKEILWNYEVYRLLGMGYMAAAFYNSYMMRIEDQIAPAGNYIASLLQYMRETYPHLISLHNNYIPDSDMYQICALGNVFAAYYMGFTLDAERQFPPLTEELATLIKGFIYAEPEPLHA